MTGAAVPPRGSALNTNSSGITTKVAIIKNL